MLQTGMVKLESQEIEIWQTNAAEANAAFCLVQEYFEVVGVVVCENFEKFQSEYFGNGRGFWLAKVNRDLAGCIGLRRLPGEKRAEIKRMYVRETFRGRGVARKLLQAAEEFAREKEYAEIYLDTASTMVEAARLYESNGYERCQSYNDNPQAAIFMRKVIRPNDKQS